MQRAYLEEDLSLIQKYFPGARSVRLRTPFDITDKPARLPRLPFSSFRDAASSSEEAAWIH
jgi:hypothetical protein